MRIYFSGLGGVGIGPLALIAKQMGHDVLGSDANSSRYTELISEAGVEVSFKQDGKFLAKAHQNAPIDWFVHTSALPADHPELVTANELGLKTSKRDELLNRLIEDKNLRLIAVSGTHGKTTTTGMLIWLFKELGLPISYSIGTNLSFGPSGQYQEDSRYFVYEADEFDRNFLSFKPYASIVTSVDHDHFDVYPTLDEYLDAFAEFIANSHCVFLWREDVEKIGGLPNGCLHTFGAESDTAVYRLPGDHNRRNAHLAVSALNEIVPDAGVPKLTELINKFPGTERRFEKLADNLYTDYAHHPAEIAATLQMARELNKQVVAVYQPHQNSRQHEIGEQYKHAFDLAERVYWLPTYLSREDSSLKILSPQELIDQLDNPAKAEAVNLDDKLASKISNELKNGRLVVMMSAGDLDAWARDKFSKPSA